MLSHKYQQKIFLVDCRIFFSTFVHKIDSKGRVSIPALFRQVLMRAGDASDGVVLFPSYTQDALEGMSMAQFTQLAGRIEELDGFSTDKQDFMASILASAVVHPIDREGRITLSEEFCAHAHIEGTVAFVGQNTYFQIWNAERFRAFQIQAQKRLRDEQKTLRSTSLTSGRASSGASV